ncbi:alpha/beta fold hydrolase [Paenibacillus sp. 481]|uniref:alpha/beta fold hydrolase n=1 Tax=Paenibacillus sp. 481 TaxID=2835869 RepID=UPI0022B37E82|nr:alpha/beta hydrolase [Paenibacillus sp. 481]
MHGWGMSDLVWRHCAIALPQFSHHYVSFADCATAAELREAVLAPLRREGGDWHIVAWSLGGMLVLDALDEQLRSQGGQLEPEENGAGLFRAIVLCGDHTPRAVIRSVVLTGTTLRFVDEAGAGWHPRIIARMRRRLATEPRQTLLAFAETIRPSSDDSRVAECLERAVAATSFSAAGLDAGLAYLQQSDLTQVWQRLMTHHVPICWLHGEDDSVCPKLAFDQARIMAEQVSVNNDHRKEHMARFISLPFSGHAPFLTQPQRWLKELNAWYEQFEHGNEDNDSDSEFSAYT